MCPEGCRKDEHEKHRARYPVTIRRKGLDVKSRQAECDCAQCGAHGPDWRGEPVDLPPKPRYEFPKAWVQPDPRREALARKEAARIARIRARGLHRRF